jgi:hypothetical protein
MFFMMQKWLLHRLVMGEQRATVVDVAGFDPDAA